MVDPKPWKGDRERIGVDGSLHRRILDLCESVGLVLVGVRGLDHLSRETLVFHDQTHLTEVTIEGLSLDEEEGDAGRDLVEERLQTLAHDALHDTGGSRLEPGTWTETNGVAMAIGRAEEVARKKAFEEAIALARGNRSAFMSGTHEGQARNDTADRIADALEELRDRAKEAPRG